MKPKNSVSHIEKVNNDTFLIAEYDGHIELINKNNLTCLNHLQLKEIGRIT